MNEIKDRDELATKLSDLVQSHWEENNQPLLLSKIGLWLREHVSNHSQLLGEENLRAFLNLYSKKFKVVQHPQQYAKIGVVPPSESYDFPDSLSVESNEVSATTDLKRSRGAFYSFIRELSRLDQEDIESVKIPTRVIVRLLEGK